MALIKSIKGISPTFGEGCFLAENATITGDVVMGKNCTVWYQAVLRGDVHTIRIGDKVNIQDHAMVHCTYQRAATTIGNGVSIGHRAIIHGCTIHNNVLIGMGAIVMDNAVVHSNSIVAAGAVVLENTIIESDCIYAGVPAKKVKTISEEQTKRLIEGIADKYVIYASWIDD